MEELYQDYTGNWIFGRSGTAIFTRMLFERMWLPEAIAVNRRVFVIVIVPACNATILMILTDTWNGSVADLIAQHLPFALSVFKLHLITIYAE
ncbi:hypothetical protein CW304_15820 [Bacillus sp. UFRGS-B20]|nr:hypothetical protein CW304_15820 [Bacillus sp. UFRGS-B20]